MSTNRIIIVVVAIALLVTAGFITQSAVVTARSVSAGNEARAVQVGASGRLHELAEIKSEVFPVDARAAQLARLARLHKLAEIKDEVLQVDASVVEQDERGREADAARWVAMGEFYKNLKSVEADTQAHNAVIDAARYTGLALEYYEVTGKKSSLPACIPAEIMAELPANIGGNQWKALVPVCSQ